MNKINSIDSTLSMIKSVYAERDRKECDRLRANRIEMNKRDGAEKERIQHSNSLLNSYIEKAMVGEKQQKQKYNQILQNIYDEIVKKEVRRSVQDKRYGKCSKQRYQECKSRGK